MALLSREGSKYGILFVITAVNSNAVRYRTLQNFRQLFVLQMNDPSDYSGILGSTGGVVPGRCKGKGLGKTDKVYEFQTASASAGDTALAVRTFCDTLPAAAGIGRRAYRFCPERVTPSFVADAIDGEQLRYPVGVEKDSLRTAVFALRSRPVHYVLSQSGSTAFSAGAGRGDSRPSGASRSRFWMVGLHACTWFGGLLQRRRGAE